MMIRTFLLSVFLLSFCIALKASAEDNELVADYEKYPVFGYPAKKPLIIDSTNIGFNNENYAPIENEKWVLVEKNTSNFVTINFSPYKDSENSDGGKIDYNYAYEHLDKNKDTKDDILFINPVLLNIKKNYAPNSRAALIKPDFFFENYSEEFSFNQDGQSIELKLNENVMKLENNKCKLVLKDGNKKQTLGSTCETESSSLIWAGDLDNDGKMDLILRHFSSQPEGSELCGGFASTSLYLSSKTKKPEIVGKAATFDEIIGG